MKNSDYFVIFVITCAIMSGCCIGQPDYQPAPTSPKPTEKTTPNQPTRTVQISLPPSSGFDLISDGIGYKRQPGQYNQKENLMVLLLHGRDYVTKLGKWKYRKDHTLYVGLMLQLDRPAEIDIEVGVVLASESYMHTLFKDRSYSFTDEKSNGMSRIIKKGDQLLHTTFEIQKIFWNETIGSIKRPQIRDNEELELIVLAKIKKDDKPYHVSGEIKWLFIK